MMNHHSCSNFAQAVGDEEGDGDKAVVADPGETLQTPLKPNRLHQINLEALLESSVLDQLHFGGYQGDLEESPLAKGVEASAGGEKPEVMHESLEECSKGHGDHRLQQGVSFKSRK